LSSDTTNADQRWARARSLADGFLDAEMPRRRRRVLLWIAALAVSTWVLGILLALLVPDDMTSRGESSIDRPALLVGSSVLLLGLLISIGGFVWAKRTGRYITRWKQVVSPLKLSERKWVMKQIRGKIEPDPDKLPILVAFARQIRATTVGVAPLFVGAAMMPLGTTIVAGSEFARWLIVAALALFAVAAGLMTRDYRLAGKFLTRHGDELDKRPMG
jgi:hypothetical protein